MSAEKKIHVIETIEATENNSQLLKEELLKIVRLSKQERGCLLYDLYQDPLQLHRFVVIICFIDIVAYEEHISAPYIQEFEKKFGDWLYKNVKETLCREI